MVGGGGRRESLPGGGCFESSAAALWLFLPRSLLCDGCPVPRPMMNRCAIFFFFIPSRALFLRVFQVEEMLFKVMYVVIGE